MDIIPKSNQAFELEHSWLVQLPFIQKRDNITVILVNQYDENIFNAILSIVEEDTLVIANTDLLHCGPNYGNKCPLNIKEYNEQTVDDIIKMKSLSSKNMCGKNAVEIFRRIAVIKDWNNYSKYYTSSDIIEATNNSVGYSTIIYIKLSGGGLPIKELISIPRKVMESELVKLKLGNKISYHELQELTNILSNDKIYDFSYGIFVTIENNKELRGCIGQFVDSNQLDRLITELTLKSAFFDSRFYDNMITINELSELSYKVNFISPPFTIYEHSENDIYQTVKDNLIVGKHGITLYFDNNTSSTYLANVLIEAFDIKEINKKNWEKLRQSLASKANTSSNEIIKVELYECQEYDENYRKYKVRY